MFKIGSLAAYLSSVTTEHITYTREKFHPLTLFNGDAAYNMPQQKQQPPQQRHAYPNYGYRTVNAPTNLSAPPSGPDIAIPESVIITNNNHLYGDGGSLASTTISMPQQSSNGAASTPLVHQKPQIQQQQQVIRQQQIQLNQDRAIHRINLSSIRHNYNEVQTSASRQHCQVIVVVKADGYGHGALETATHLVEHCGATCFAVATLEEGISLRRAFEEKFPNLVGGCKVRILVLGSPVGFPTCFDSYLHNNIELMVSGPEVAASLAQWMKNHDSRRRAEVERVAERLKEGLMDEAVLGDFRNPMRHGVVRQVSTGRDKTNEALLKEERGDHNEVTTCNTTVTSTNDAAFSDESTGIVQEAQNGSKKNNPPPQPVSPSRLQTKYNAATLTNVTGDDLAREVRQILVGQRHATAKAAPQASKMTTISEPSVEDSTSSRNSSPKTSRKASEVVSENEEEKKATSNKSSALAPSSSIAGGGSLFCGIDDAARASRQRELRSIRLSQLGKDIDSTTAEAVNGMQVRKKLRWHALVDSGMGRLGFKTDTDESLKNDVSCEDGLSDGESSSENSGIRDTVSIIKELYDAEVHEGAPIEFFGMCTHMADANETSTYTNDQMERFRSLLHRVRSAGIAVPSISTDNSAALLTTALKHFNPNAILAHDTRGYVRCGGAIYGQRPAFKQLRAVSTLCATVKHVAIIKQGQSVGYDRAYVAPLDVRIATLTVGFADGYPRELGNGVGKVSIRGSIFPVAGNVCMDMLMVDLGPADDTGEGSRVAVGDTAVLWGPEETDVEECGDGLVPLAELAGTLKTTQSALTCGLDKFRVRRELVG